MLDFKSPTLDDYALLKKYYKDYGTIGCDCNPANTIMWGKKYNIKICEVDNFLLRAIFNVNNQPFGYCYPMGLGDETPYINLIIEDALERGVSANFMMLTEEQCNRLIDVTGEKYSFKELTGDEDYIYNFEDLSLLPGKKYHSKRNHISKFNRNYPNWHFDLISQDNKQDAMTVMDKWCINNNIDVSTYEEYYAMKMAFDNYSLFKMHGGILYVNDIPVAMTMGSAINRDVFDVCFEKALTEYDGSYAKVNNEFAKTLVGFKYINREEDLGLESLRKAKLSYHPAVILKRFIGVKND